MIKIVDKEKKKKSVTPHYQLKYKYMIGDADGDTSEKVHLSLDNPYIERYVKLINSLKPLEGHWGIVFEQYKLKKYLDEKQITEDDFHFLNATMYGVLNKKDPYFKSDDKYYYEFEGGVRGETEYSFLVFEGSVLKYIDDTGTSHDTIFV